MERDQGARPRPMSYVEAAAANPKDKKLPKEMVEKSPFVIKKPTMAERFGRTMEDMQQSGFMEDSEEQVCTVVVLVKLFLKSPIKAAKLLIAKSLINLPSL